jgi:hypothetical protein
MLREQHLRAWELKPGVRHGWPHLHRVSERDTVSERVVCLYTSQLSDRMLRCGDPDMQGWNEQRCLRDQWRSVRDVSERYAVPERSLRRSL